MNEWLIKFINAMTNQTSKLLIWQNTLANSTGANFKFWNPKIIITYKLIRCILCADEKARLNYVEFLENFKS